ncbi:hypothetical protein SEA_PIPER2020_55 [Mycobacterium phage Piper2020]|nr:hypothetical protein SEA_MISHA28_53 [Mycobacterium phage Misha28]AVP42484.1 hypothetical protein SEA_TOOTSIEPOP_53 [Mycobacterium phage TootsiePop]QBP31734.1 hypothetical protein SEA_PIPER2020_55 [Mycobacterium phage Piper2020]
MMRTTFHKRTVRRFLAAVAAGAVLAGASIGFAAHADADSVIDDAYLMTLDERGITYPSPTYAINTGHQVCALLDAGAHWSQVATLIARNSTIDVNDAAYLVGASMAAYCPEHAADAGVRA